MREGDCVITEVGQSHLAGERCLRHEKVIHRPDAQLVLRRILQVRIARRKTTEHRQPLDDTHGAALLGKGRRRAETVVARAYYDVIERFHNLNPRSVGIGQ